MKESEKTEPRSQSVKEKKEAELRGDGRVFLNVWRDPRDYHAFLRGFGR